jgi:hypothetical protein
LVAAPFSAACRRASGLFAAAALRLASLRDAGVLARAALRACSLRLGRASSVSVTVSSLPFRLSLPLRLSGGDQGHEYQHSGVGVDLGAARLRPARLGALRAALGLDAGG